MNETNWEDVNTDGLTESQKRWALRMAYLLNWSGPSAMERNQRRWETDRRRKEKKLKKLYGEAGKTRMMSVMDMVQVKD